MTDERKAYLIEKYAKRWDWCSTCKCASVRYSCCGNSTCNCGGCENCDETYDEVMEMYREGIAPKITDIPGAIALQREHDVGYVRNSLMRGATCEDVAEWIRICKEHYDGCSFDSIDEITLEEFVAITGDDELSRIFPEEPIEKQIEVATRAGIKPRQ